MRRELLTPFALSLGAALIAVSCSANDPSSEGEPDTSPTTGATPTTEPTAGTGAPDTSPEASDAGGPQGFGTDRLNFFGECPALLEYMQTEASERVTPWGLQGSFGPMTAVDVVATEDLAVAEESSAEPAPPTGGDGDFSGTNTQEIGVDEGDIVETDGSYVYVAGQRGLQIVSVADAEVVAAPELPEGQQQMILDGTRLIVVTSGWSGASDTIVSSYDVSDPTAPELLRRSHLEGAVVATRSADGIARLVISTSLQERLPFVQPTQFGLDEERALERNRQIIEQSEVEDWLPRWFDEAGDGTFGPMQQALDCEDVAAPRDFSGLGITWIASVDLQGIVDPVGSAGIVSTGDTVYASPTNLYIATQDWAWQFGPLDVDPIDDEEETSVAPGPPPTLIHQFALGTGTDAAYVASGEVEGRLLNQFAMSEHNGDLRVATTTEEFGFGEQSESTVFVLRPDGQDLRVISSVGGLGRDERIFAVRFFGDVGYVVTFRQTDPLYVVDLSDPENPVLDGELKIPGYSAYLHPVGDDLLLGVGQDATEEGRALGTQMSLFDVSDPTDPQRIDSMTIGGWSEVEWDHKAFLFWEPDGTIVLPVSPGWSDCPPGQTCLAEEIKGPAGGVVVAELDGRSLKARGTISHTSSRQNGCWNPLLRSIAIDDELVTVALDQLQFSDRQSLEPRDAVRWGDAEDYGCWWYWE